MRATDKAKKGAGSSWPRSRLASPTATAGRAAVTGMG